MQLKDMSAANMQKVVETVGNVDADNAFFRVMQGRAAHKTNGVEYKGGEIVVPMRSGMILGKKE